MTCPRRLRGFLALVLACVLACHGHRAHAGFTVEGSQGYLSIDSRIQAAYARVFDDAPAGGEGTSGDGTGVEEAGETNGEAADRFYIQQARLDLHGAHGDRFTYRLTAELGNTEVPLRDACIGVRVAPWIKVTIGQFKVPYSFHRLSSGADLLIAWRPDVADALVPGRDIGVMVDLGDEEGHYRFRAGGFTGRGQNVVEDDARGRPLWAIRADWSPFHPMSTRKNPTSRAPAFAANLGLDAARSDDGETGAHGSLDSIDGRKTLLGADVAVAFRGLWVSLEANAAYFEPRASNEAPYIAAGYLAQIGWYLPALRVEPAIRFDTLDPNDQEDADRRRTLSLGINAYPTADAHFKIMVDYAHRFPVTSEASSGWTGDELRVLVQFVLG